MRALLLSILVTQGAYGGGKSAGTCEKQGSCLSFEIEEFTEATMGSDTVGGCNDLGKDCYFEVCVTNTFGGECTLDKYSKFDFTCPKEGYENQCEEDRGFGDATKYYFGSSYRADGETQCQFGKPNQILEFIFKDGFGKYGGCGSLSYVPDDDDMLGEAEVHCRDEDDVEDDIYGWKDCSKYKKGECVWEVKLPPCTDTGMRADPVVVSKDGSKTHFWLPLGTWVPMLKVHDVELLARSFGRVGTHQQWIDGIAVKQGGELVFDAVVEHENKTLRSRLDHEEISPLASLSSPSISRISPATNVAFDIHRTEYSYLLGGYETQVNVHTPYFDLQAFLMPAVKYADPEQAVKYAHIDYRILNFKDTDKCQGFGCDLMFGTHTVDDATMKNYTTKPTKADIEAFDFEIAQPPEILANQSQVVYS